MGRKMKELGPRDRCWLFLEWDAWEKVYRPFGASLAKKEAVAREDMQRAGAEIHGPLLAVSAPASILLEHCRSIPVYLASTE